MLRITVDPWECTARLEEEAVPKTYAAFKKLLRFRNKLIQVLDWSLESMSEALLTGLCQLGHSGQQKGQGIREWLAFKVF
jgi:hypothetical protein